MGKIKSAVITAIVVLATLALFLFGVVSCDLSDGVHRYNSILSNIHLGSEFSGDAFTTLLPEGVITSEEYSFTVVENDEKAAEYEEKYVATASGAYYVERDLLSSFGAGSDEAAFEALAKQTASDADIISARFAVRGYTSYSVGVVDGCAIKVSVPTNFTYAAYSGVDTSSVTGEITYASNAINYLTQGGDLTLRNNTRSIGEWDDVSSAQAADEHATTTYNIIDSRYDISDIISGASEEEPGVESPAPESPEPTTSPSPSVDPDVKTMQYSVTLPDGDPDEIVTVRINGSGYDQTRQVPLMVQSVVFNITGKGKQKYDIYINGAKDHSIEIDFDTGEVKPG